MNYKNNPNENTSGIIHTVLHQAVIVPDGSETESEWGPDSTTDDEWGKKMVHQIQKLKTKIFIESVERAASNILKQFYGNV